MSVLPASAQLAPRTIPRPLPNHPGNIFAVGETVAVPLPAGNSNTWHATDYEGKAVAQGTVESGTIKFGQLPVGYYEATDGTTNRPVTLGVLEPLRAPTPLDSPIGIDVALAWCFPQEQWPAAISFCQLAGMNRVRDRLLWGEMEPKRGELAASNRYDLSLKMQTEAGLQVLDVNHASAGWANTNGTRMPLDLRDAYNFYRAIAQRWHGKIAGFEPWNEADIIEFGGHTGNEMASMQKASYLGLKAGDPTLTVCENVFAIHRQTTLRNFNDNQAWAYFETCNLHHYEAFTGYPKEYADIRAISAGRPLWTTECNWTVLWSGDPALKEPNLDQSHLQSERVAKIFTLAIHEGSKAVFFFMLPHYFERNEQFGLLHPDLTPRPSYLALAAVGRLMAGAQPLGRVETPDKATEGYLFTAKPAGKDTDVLVIWSEGEGEYELPKQPDACFDHLGRPVAVTGKAVKLTHAPLFVLLAKDSRPAVVAPPATPPFLDGKPGAIVLQAVLPPATIDLLRSGYKIKVAQTNDIPVFAYNFGSTPARGQLHVNAPKGWVVDFATEVELAPGERKELTLHLMSAKSWAMAARVGLKGDFGAAGDPVLALRFFPVE